MIQSNQISGAPMNTQQIAAQGRYGDNTLVHASTDEVQGLDALARSVYGQNLPRNPQTGLPEAFLFAPLMAPLLAGGLGMTGAIGTGLLAGGLGAAEAAARGMDDPLQQGLLAGLTGGAAAGIGNALSAAGTQAATQTGAQAAGQVSPQALTQTTEALMRNPALAAASPTLTQAMPQAAPGFLQGVGQAAQGIPQKFSQMGKGIEALMQPGAFAEGGVGQTFLQQAKIPAIAGATGLMGQSALKQEQSARDAAEAAERERERDYQMSSNVIRNIAQRNPASMAGQAYYNPYQPRSYFAAGGYLDGGAVPGDGMSDSQPAMIDNQQPAALSSGEFVMPADVVSGLGNGSSDAGAKQLYAMMDRIRRARTGTTEQAPKVDPNRMMAA